MAPKRPSKRGPVARHDAGKPPERIDDGLDLDADAPDDAIDLDAGDLTPDAGELADAGGGAAAAGSLALVRSDPVGRFLAEARRHPRLSEDEERRLAALARQGDVSAAHALVLHNLRLVVAIALQYQRAWTQLIDLIQEGTLGLIEAVRRWEATLGARFGSYASYWIRAYVEPDPMESLRRAGQPAP